jgi:hypothetical protein
MMQLQHARKDKNPLATFTDLEAELQTIQSELTALGVMLGPRMKHERNRYDPLAHTSHGEIEDTRTYTERLPAVEEEEKYVVDANGDYILEDGKKIPKNKYVMNKDGEFILEDGKKIPKNKYLMNKDGEFVLDTQGQKILKEKPVNTNRYPEAIEEEVVTKHAWVERFNAFFGAKTETAIEGIISDFRFSMEDIYEMSPAEGCLWRNESLYGFLTKKPWFLFFCAGALADAIWARWQTNPYREDCIDFREWQTQDAKKASLAETEHNADEIERIIQLHLKLPAPDKRIHNHQMSCIEFLNTKLEKNTQVDAVFSDPTWKDYEKEDVEQDLAKSVKWTFDNIQVPMVKNGQSTKILCVKSRFPGERYRIEWERVCDEWKKENPNINMVEMKYYNSVALNPYKKLSHKKDPKDGANDFDRIALGHGVKGVFYWIFFSAYNARIQCVDNSPLWNDLVVHGREGFPRVTPIKCGDVAKTYSETWSTDYLEKNKKKRGEPGYIRCTELSWDIPKTGKTREDIAERDQKRVRNFHAAEDESNNNNSQARYEKANALFEANKMKNMDDEGFTRAGPKGNHTEHVQRGVPT